MKDFARPYRTGTDESSGDEQTVSLQSDDRPKSIDSACQAAHEGDIEPVKSILETAPSLLNAHESRHGDTMLMSAVRGGRAGVTALLLSHADILVNESNRMGQTALHMAAHSCDEARVNMLLNRAADPTAFDGNGRRPADLVSLDHFSRMSLLAKLQEAEKQYVTTCKLHKKKPYKWMTTTGKLACDACSVLQGSNVGIMQAMVSAGELARRANAVVNAKGELKELKTQLEAIEARRVIDYGAKREAEGRARMITRLVRDIEEDVAAAAGDDDDHDDSGGGGSVSVTEYRNVAHMWWTVRELERVLTAV